uniref:Bromo domain-containing protein n=1 Tax=Dendroctonus ponderosae TaxID=77166 RepID=A0AAR5Q514_DENPD
MDSVKPSSNANSELDRSRLTSEVYFLIQRFLSNGPLKRTLQTLNEELHAHQILPKRLDWQGNEHNTTVDDMERQNPQIRPDFLYFLCSQASSALNPNTRLAPSFLSFHPNTKNENGVYSNHRQYFNNVSRYRGVSIQDAKAPFNIINSIRGNETGGPLSRSNIISPRIYKGMQMQRITIGHLSAVYCLLFDHSGKYVITGADDLLIKLWSSATGRLIAAFRGASSEITDIAVDPENHLLAAGSIDRILRVWDLQTGAPIAVLTGHTGMITSVNFCPTPCWGHKYLISTSTDGSIAFWIYNSEGVDNKVQFRNTPNLYQEKIRPGQAQMICSSFSPGGTFLATGSADHHVRVYYMKGDEGPQRILETEAHTDRVDSIQWAHSGLKFLSGSKDGTAVIWWFERQQWKNLYLDMSTKLASDKPGSEPDSKKIRVTMVAWDKSDASVVTAVSDYSLKIWSAANGQLIKILKGHVDEVYVLEPHPHDEDVILSAGHDGQLLIWDIQRGDILFKYLNTIEGQGYGAIFDAKWSPDGCSISASDSHGDIMTFGFGIGSPFYQQLPRELFFHTDYRPLVRDQNNWVLDEQTQVPPHLMPPPFLVDIDGNPYPPMLQRLVPGRENCNVDQLVPNIVIGNEGIQEVIQDVSQRVVVDSEDDDDVRGNAGGSIRTHRIRQSRGDWQTDHNIEWKKNLLVKPLSPSVLKRSNEIRKLIEVAEKKEYQRQLRTRPLMINTAGPSNPRKKVPRKRAPNGTRKRKQEVDMDIYDIGPLCPYASDESSFSDWTEEISEAKRRRSTRRNNNKYNRSETSSDSDDTTDDTDQTEEDSEGVSDQERTERKSRSTRENKAKIRHASPKPSTSRQQGSTRAAVPKNPVIPKQDPVPKTGQMAKLTAAEPSCSAVASTSQGPKLKVSEQYKLSEWLAETRPRKSPYYPQMHDEIVYFVQGHILYMEAVKQKNVYEPDIKELPWVKGMQLNGHEFCKVVGIRYEIKPPRLCCLKLALQDETGCLTGRSLTVRYHDMPDVLDFFVLKQCYLTAMSRDWQSGEKFRCMIDDNWWIGEVSCKLPANDPYPVSAFMCYEISWTNGEQERMSPWDMEPIDDSRLPEDDKAAIPVLEHELRSILYKPVSEDWPNCERDTVCKAIARGITQVMELAIAEPFLVPVDINVYPTYAMIVEYPIDLSTIKARFENNFYRRVSAAEFDIRYLATNAAKFNEQQSSIVKHAKILTELCLRIVKIGNNAIDIASIYHQLVDEYYSSHSDGEGEIDVSQPSTSRTFRYLPVRSWKSPDDWKIEARGLFELMWQTDDSVPFREPVNKNKYPTYYQVITDPMDLETVKDKLAKGEYKIPSDFCSDMRLIFQNSRTFNTNKRSRIYVMTVRLSAMFEEHVKKIVSNWRTAKKRQRRLTPTSDESDGNISDFTDSRVEIEKPDPVKVIFEETKNGSISESDSDNTPLEFLKAASRSNTATESDTTLDKMSSFAAVEEEELALEQDKRLNENGVNHFHNEPSTSSQSPLEDFDHNYSNQKLGHQGRKLLRINRNDTMSNMNSVNSSLTNSKSEQNNKNEIRHSSSKDSDSSDDNDDDYRPPVQLKRLDSYHSSNADSSEDENVAISTLSLKSQKVNASTGSDEESDSLNLLEVQSELRRNKAVSDDEEFRPDDSSDSSISSRPKRRRKNSSDYEFTAGSIKNNTRTKRQKRKPSFVVEEDEDTSSSNSSDSETSDDSVPLQRAAKRRQKTKKNEIFSTTDSEAGSPPRSRRKRRRLVARESLDSDDDNQGENEKPGFFGNVSSRGRVRKITERAAAFLKKDKKSG